MSQGEGGWARPGREKSWLVLLPTPEKVRGADVLHIALSQCGEAWIYPCSLRTVQSWVSHTSPGWLPTKRWQKSLLAGLRGFRATKANWQAAGYQVA